MVVDDSCHAQDVHRMRAGHWVDDGVLRGDVIADEALVPFDASEPLASPKPTLRLMIFLISVM